MENAFIEIILMLEHLDQLEANNFASDKNAFTLCARLNTNTANCCADKGSNTQLHGEYKRENMKMEICTIPVLSSTTRTADAFFLLFLTNYTLL